MGQVSRLLVACAVCLSASAGEAAGFYFGENGLKALSMGGAFTGHADDLSAITLNPAGLTQLQGFHYLIEAQALSLDVRFQRTDAAVREGLFEPVENEAGLFLLPAVGVGYGTRVGGRALTFAFGIFGPPAVGKLEYPVPNYEKQPPGEGQAPIYVESPAKFAPQRYSLIDYDIFIAFPSLTAAYELHRRVQLGLTVQYVHSRFEVRRAIYNGLTPPPDALRERPDEDSVFSTRLTGTPRVTAILGARVQATDTLAFGASVKPQVPLVAKGTASIELGEFAREVGATLEGDEAELRLTLPLEARLGAHYRPLPQLSLNADVVYQRWSAFRDVRMSLEEVTLDTPLTEPKSVGSLRVPQNWKDTWSGRIGGEWAFPFGLAARLGLLYEPGAAPDEYVNVEFPHFARMMVTSGLSFSLGSSMEVLGSFVFVPSTSKTITDSEVRMVNSDPSIPGGVVGNGRYRSGGFSAGIGIRGHFPTGSGQRAPTHL